MKKLSAHSPSLLILFFCVIFSYNVSGQNLKNNPKSLPPINYSDINPESIEPGKFRIKFSADVEQKIASPGSLKSSAGTIITGLSEIDALHQKFNVNKGNALLSNLYDKNLKSISVNKKKHNHHGLHLWYEFEADETIDIKNIIAQYGKLKGVDIVEPVFKKVPILPVENPLMPNTNNASANLVELLSWMPEDERFDEQWHYHNTGQNDGTEDADIDLPEAWNLERGQPEVIVAVFDQGVDIAHPDLAANIWSGVGPQGANTLPGPHGTHVAGTIAAVNNNQIGVSGIAGGSGNDDGVRIMTLDIFSEENELSTLEMYVWAADNGAAISQNSWGYINPDVYNLSDLEGIDYFNEHGGGDVLAGGLTIFAAGNETDDGQWFPGCYEGTLAVAATNNNDQLAYYSNYGDWIDISAPGGETYISSTGVLSTVANNGYEYFQGTSMACPHVSGVAALVLSQTPGLLTNNELKSILTESSDNHYAQNPSYEGKLGNGRLNAYNALISAQQYMGDVINPTSVLAAGISETQIELQWMLNEVGDNVMIAFSEVPELGTPENGILYSPGDEIPGGGQVIYSGNNTSFITGGLSSNTIGYFRIWSYDAATEYSFGRNVQAFTLSPAMRITPDQLDFGFVYVGYPKSVTFQIQNEGTLDLVISDVGFSDNNFSSANSPTIIEPQATFEWEILFTPAQTGNYTGTLSFSSNDPEFQNVAVELNATVSDEIPALDVQPAFLEASINAGESVIKTIELSNIGDGELQYSFHAPGEPSPAVEQKTYSIKHNDANITKKGETRTVGQYANRDKLLAGGSADAGYFFRTTSINWVDASNGTELSLSDDDFSSFIPLGFSFKYFGKSYNSINVMSNGWVSFTHTSEWFPVCIPDEGGAICPLGVDLSPDNSSKIRYTTQGTAPSRKFVVEYNNVKYYDPNITSTSTFQIVFYEASNSISFQYLNVSGTPLTVGLENEDGSRGIGNCGSGDNFLNPEIVTDNLAIVFSPVNWTNALPASGSIASNQTTSVNVNLNSFNLVAGSHQRDIIISTNDPEQKEVTIPVTLNVSGEPKLVVSSDTVSFGQTFIEQTRTLPFVIDNSEGSSTLNISDITVDNGNFQMGTFPSTIAPRKSDTIVVSFTPQDKQFFEGSFTISSDDPDTPEKTITLEGEGVIGPQISAFPASFEQVLYSGDTAKETLTITNERAGSEMLEVLTLIDDTKILYLNSFAEQDSVFYNRMQNLPNISIVDSADISLFTPDVDYLLQYDIVIIAPNSPLRDAATLGDNLAAYVDRGGRICVLQPSFLTGGSWLLEGRITSPEYMPMEQGGFSSDVSSCELFVEHPLTRRVESLTSFLFSLSGIQGQGISLGKYEAGNYSVAAYNPDKPIVAINVYPGNGTFGGDFLQLMENTIGWLKMQNNLVSLSEIACAVASETSQQIDVVFDAAELDAGAHEANIMLSSNDPEAPLIFTPVTINVLDAANISVNAVEIEFGEVFTGTTSVIPFAIKNTGNKTLEISSYDFSVAEFSVTNSSAAQILPGIQDTVDVIFSPNDSGVYSGELTIVSNDPSDPECTINLAGTGVFPPEKEITPLSFNEEVNEGEDLLRSFSIANNGAEAPLDYSVEILYDGSLGTTQGGPDNDGYYWGFSNVDWVDMTDAISTSLGDDDFVKNIPLDFSFTYYGEEYTTVNIMSNGWISFTDFNDWFPTCVPGSGGVIAPYAGDLDPSNNGSVRYQTIGEAPKRKFVVEYDAPIFYSDRNNLFQVILFEENSTVTFQYADIVESYVSIGIENESGTCGIGACAEGRLHIDRLSIDENMAIDFSRAPKGWIALDSNKGTLNSGESLDHYFHISSENLLPGVYEASIIIRSNDLLQKEVTVPVQLTINAFYEYSVSFNVVNQFSDPVQSTIMTFDGFAADDGELIASGVTAGKHEYSISKPGYEITEGVITVYDSDISLDVELSANYYELTLNATLEGSGSIMGAGTYYTGEQVDVTAIPGDGFLFDSWENSSNTELSIDEYYSFPMPPHDLLLMGNFSVNTSLMETNDELMRVYPNPASKQVNVKLKNPENVSLIEITDLSGQVIAAQEPGDMDIVTFNIEDLKPATYFIRVLTNSGFSTVKLIRE